MTTQIVREEILNALAEAYGDFYTSMWGWAALCRLSSLNEEEKFFFAQARAELDSDSDKSLATGALAEIDLEGWLEAAQWLEQNPGDVEQAERLLNELDQAELVCWVGKNMGLATPELVPAIKFAADRPQLFGIAQELAQAMWASFDPNLPDRDVGLAITSLKWQILAEGIEI